MKLRNLLIIAALFCLSANAFASYVYWDETVGASAQGTASYAPQTNPKTQTYTVTLDINPEEKANITYGLYIPVANKPSYLPTEKVEGVNWWTLGNESGSKTITLSTDVGLWADFKSDKKFYASSLISAENWQTTVGTNVFQYQYNLNLPISATVTFAPVPSDPLPQQGQPLPAPVTTLLIALAFGGAFVMYRNRKQVKA